MTTIYPGDGAPGPWVANDTAVAANGYIDPIDGYVEGFVFANGGADRSIRTFPSDVRLEGHSALLGHMVRIDYGTGQDDIVNTPARQLMRKRRRKRR